MRTQLSQVPGIWFGSDATSGKKAIGFAAGDLNVHDLARDYMPLPGYFDGHNATIGTAAGTTGRSSPRRGSR